MFSWCVLFPRVWKNRSPVSICLSVYLFVRWIILFPLLFIGNSSPYIPTGWPSSPVFPTLPFRSSIIIIIISWLTWSLPSCSISQNSSLVAFQSFSENPYAVKMVIFPLFPFRHSTLINLSDMNFRPLIFGTKTLCIIIPTPASAFSVWSFPLLISISVPFVSICFLFLPF